jgi:hypothetical protein
MYSTALCSKLSEAQPRATINGTSKASVTG